MTKIGIVLASHVPELARGVYQLLKQSASDVPITYAGGTDDDKIGSSFDKINDAITSNPADELFAFYDLGSAKMTLEMAIEMSDKPIKLFDAAFVEGAYTAASLAQGSSSKEVIEEQVAALKIK
ncbi:dihydroxyacetone kinase phosphoryl donor subunit DhaM [Paraliobacillus ryukyuensis]|uniref:dihydroxyacetone kinase phosphoryl donor subunit DhaM n=1 Tax=Paraliobacillus ryukyuensis TaxID=200904 RepID=UPI0009A61863|nr:dihydroxyacetone kinase phosphoryl donor subunit DhaM [Paraliobacillus ryukyuensis]